MGHNSFTSLLLLLAFAPWSPLSAQRGDLTLGAARAAARTNHPAVRGALAGARAAHADATNVGRLGNPSLSVDRESAGAGGSGGSQLIVQMEQSLDFWGRRSARGRAGQLRAAAADTRALTEAARVEEETTLAFLAAVAAGWQESAARRTLAAFDRAVRITNERRAAGDAAGLDAKRLQLERTRALARLVAARHDRRSSLTRLATLVGRPPVALDSMRLVMDSTPNFLPQLAFDSLERAMRTTPSELDALAFEAEASEHDITGFRKAQTPIPSLRLGAKWERSDNTASRRGIAAGLSIPIPIWNSGGGAVEAARAELDVREALRDTNARERQASLAETWEGLTGHAAAFLELDRQIAANGSSLRSALDVAFAEGELSLTEWLDALRTDHETTSLHAELWLELAGRLARLERLTGLAFFQETS